jgi:ketosteroid isomerase-like protein
MSGRRESDEARIRQHVEKVVAGIHARDPGQLRALYAPDVVSFDIEPPLAHVGVDAKLKNWENVFAVFRDVAFEVRDLTVAVGGDVAFGYCFGRLSGTLNDGTTTDGMWVRATYCLEKTDDEWLITHDQVSVPLDLGTGAGLTDLAP